MFIFNAFTLFIFVSSIIFNLKYLIELVLILKKENPEKMEISQENKIYLLFTTSYIITFIIMALTH